MIISHEHKFIFVKTRKTAGSSIEKYLVDYLGPDDICTGSRRDGTPALNIDALTGHLGWQWIKENYANEWNSYYKFAVDRNPWDKMVSIYYWYLYSKPHKVRKGFEHLILQTNLDLWDDWTNYSNNQGPTVDRLLTYENLHQQFLELPIPYNNELTTTFVKSGLRKVSDYHELYTEEMQERVAKSFSQMIDHFQYQY